MSDPTKGDNPILDSGPTVTIGGEEHTLRRLGIRDTFAVARIVAVGAATLNRGGQSVDMKDPERMGELLLAGLISAEEEALKLLASVVGVPLKEFTDPSAFPMGSELTIIEALVDHQDLKAFFTQASSLMKRLPEMQTRSRAPST